MRAGVPIMLLTAFVAAALTTAHTSGITGVSGMAGTSGTAVQDLPENFTGFAINMNASSGRGAAINRGKTTATLDIRIDRWSTDEERDQLLNILKGESNVNRVNQQLLRALQRMPSVGHIRTPTTLAWDLRFARQHPLEDGKGRRIVVATDRPIGFWEARNRPRTMDYPFTLVEMHLNDQHEGEGKVLPGTRIFIDQRTNDLVLEDYNIQPVRLNQIRRR